MSYQKELELYSCKSDQQSQQKQKADLFSQSDQKQQLNSQPRVEANGVKQKNIQDSEVWVDEIEETDCRNQQKQDQIFNIEDNVVIQTEQKSSPTNNQTELAKNNFLSYKTSRTTHLEDNYFEEDQEEKEEANLIKYSVDIKNLKSYNMIFRKRQFFEFFIYHFLYFIILGPFTAIITRLGGKYLSRNLQFIGRSRSVYLQLVNYLMSIVTILFYFTFTHSTINQAVYFSTLLVVVVFRCFQISTKYATFDPLKIKIYKQIKIKIEDLKYDLFLQDWSQQTEKIIYEQVYYTQRFFDTDPNLFFIQLMVEPSKKTSDQIENSRLKMEEQFNFRKTHKKPDPIGIQTNQQCYDGYTIIHFLISLYQKSYSSKRVALKNLILLLSVIRGLLPLICALIISFSSSVLGMYWNEIAINIILSLQVQTLYSAIFLQMSFGLSDLHRKLTILQELSYMLIPRKIGDTNISKVLPTINILKKESLKGWSILRKSIMAYGKSYSLRVEILIAVMALYAFACLLLIVLSYFKVMNINIVIIVEIGFDSILMIIIVCFVLFWGANLNQTFTDQITNLYNNKIYVQDLLLVQDSYINKGKISNNFLYNKGLQIAKQNLEENQSIKEYLQDLLEYYQQIIDEVQFDQQNYPFKFLGITVTPIVLQSLLVALASIISSVLFNYANQYLNSKNS
ncbi:transmembrane protein, putative (macronuclear) [Tetrahymena thermophila SB210]|uniref:Transmembrane protein, putative n=1 Tax=Tetrahymena thermophila (strain SB210) TaxID=312017 RepID=Q23F73_TETTS|nr:transmembrane protein, putative [Tetrahymena thermophila SB210]EAR95280.2 transmembrane protein, putative [Tetrahymena thermophila SB210]|eukprot:XP_001015525.2 transmembrane protein, putative [Tetrahymena thermophila SB210]